MQKIILIQNEKAKRWTALFFRVPGMPQAEELLLRWHWTAHRDHVANDMRHAFPEAKIWYRDIDGSVMAHWFGN
jgi:hypothetical protein